MATDQPDQPRYLTCKNGDCAHTIWLPRISQLGKSPGLPESANNSYSENYVCPACNRAYPYRSLNVAWSSREAAGLRQKEEPYAAVLEFECDEGNCGARVAILKPGQAPLTSEAIIQESDSWVLEAIHCDRGHPIQGLPSNRRGYAIGAGPARVFLS